MQKNNNFDIPIYQKSYEFYKTLHSYQNTIPKSERFTIWQKCQNTCLDILEGLLLTAQMNWENRVSALYKVSLKVDIIRTFIRLSFDTKAIDQKKYLTLQKQVDEIGKMLWGWIRTSKQK